MQYSDPRLMDLIQAADPSRIDLLEFDPLSNPFVDDGILNVCLNVIERVDLKEKGTPLHEATVVGDTVGDPFKDTSSVAMNPIIKFTTLFGLLAMEIAISESFRQVAPIAGWIFLIIALVFVIRSFYAMRIPVKK